MVGVRQSRPPAPSAWTESAGTPADEADLIAAARLDPRAFAPLYRTYFDPVFRYCFRCLGDREEAAEATQEVFARALRALPRYRDQSFRPWLFTIAHNVIVDSHRQQSGRPPNVPIAAAYDRPDPEPGPEEAALAAETNRSVHRYLSLLPPDQRAVVELRLADLTGKEVAAVLSRSLGSVKIAQHRAFARLRDLMRVEAGKEGSDALR